MNKVLNRRIDRLPKDSVYVGRPTKFGNPFEIGKDGDRKEVINKYKNWFYSNPELMEDAINELSGKDLVCWCSPKPCHADVLLKFVSSYELF